MRSCTVERARPSLRASEAVGSRAFAFKSAINLVSPSRMAFQRFAGLPGDSPEHSATSDALPPTLRLLLPPCSSSTRSARNSAGPVDPTSCLNRKMGCPHKAGDDGGKDGSAMKNVLLVGGGKI